MCFKFPQSDDISGGLHQGIVFGEREIYILAKGYFRAKVISRQEVFWGCKKTDLSIRGVVALK